MHRGVEDLTLDGEGISRDGPGCHAGAWACAAAKMVARNCRESAAGGGREFAEAVRMWVYEEEVDGRKLVRLNWPLSL